VVWQHIVLMHDMLNVCFRIIQYILVHLLVLIFGECVNKFVKYKVLMVFILHTTVLGDATPCSLVKKYWSFKGHLLLPL
jgi:hypothetical protein